MSENTTPYGVSYIATAPEEFKVGDKVETVNADNHRMCYIGMKGTVTDQPNPSNGHIRVILDSYPSAAGVDFKPEWLRKLPDTIRFDENNNPEECKPIPLLDVTEERVKRFKEITDEMAKTYRAKNKTYGDAYGDGFRRFGAVQLVSRIYEKYCRIENLLVRKADNKVPDESVLDTITDMAVQLVVLRTLLEPEEVDFENVV